MLGAAAAGPRAKRTKVPKTLMEADKEDAMDLKSLSQFVRDLCRQYKLDRVAWEETAETINDHASRIDCITDHVDHMADELLQVNDEVSRVIDGAIQVSRNQEEQNRRQVLEAVEQVSKGANIVDTNLRFTITELQKEFKNEGVEGRNLVKILEQKFETLDLQMKQLNAQGVQTAQHVQQV